MSMNLHCNKVDLWQTPTHISYMCTMNEEGARYEVTGKEAKRALFSYIEWVKSTLNGVYSTPEEIQNYERHKESVQYHIEEVTSVLDAPDLEVSIM